MIHSTDRRAQNRGPRVAVAEHRKEITECAEYDDEIADITDPRADPVTPRRVEADELAGAGACVSIDAVVQIGFARRQGLINEREHQHARAGD
jgi:hypothetical protein